MFSLRGRLLAACATLAVAVASGGCQSPSQEEDANASEHAFSVPAAPSEGEERTITMSNIPAQSRVAAERANGLPDATIATWHVHYVKTKEGFRGNVVYGTDDTNQVRLMVVIAEDAKSLVLVEPDADSPSEGSLAMLAQKPSASPSSLSSEMLPWIHDELIRMSTSDTSSPAETESLRPQAITLKCAARISTMLLTVVAGVMGGPVVGFIASAAEAAAWGDFQGAAVVGGLGAGVAMTDAMKKSSSKIIRATGSAVRGVGAVGLVGLVGVGIWLDPKEALSSLIPPQCRDSH